MLHWNRLPGNRAYSIENTPHSLRQPSGLQVRSRVVSYVSLIGIISETYAHAVHITQDDPMKKVNYIRTRFYAYSFNLQYTYVAVVNIPPPPSPPN